MSPSQMVQTVSVDVGDFKAVEKVTSEAVAKLGPVQVRDWGWGDRKWARLGGARRGALFGSDPLDGAVRYSAIQWGGVLCSAVQYETLLFFFSPHTSSAIQSAKTCIYRSIVRLVGCAHRVAFAETSLVYS